MGEIGGEAVKRAEVGNRRGHDDSSIRKGKNPRKDCVKNCDKGQSTSGASREGMACGKPRREGGCKWGRGGF